MCFILSKNLGFQLNFVLTKFLVSEYDSFRFSINSISFSASFWKVCVETGAGPPVHTKISGTKLLYSTSRILCFYFNVLTLSLYFLESDVVLWLDLAWELEIFTSKKVRLNWPPQSPFVLMLSRASSSVVAVLL